jgi:predicted acylesterase/phospholipase RssA
MNNMFLSMQGGGPEGDRIAGAMAGFHAELGRFSGYSGASIGAVNAAIGSFHVDDKQALDLYVKYLQRNRMLDPTFGSLMKLQLLEWSKIEELSEKIFGKNTRLKDSVSDICIVVSSLDNKCPMYLSNKTHPNVRVAEALKASCAIHPRVTGAQTIPSLGSKISPDIRRFIDGGWTDNTADAVFDDLGIRIAITLEPEPLERVRSVSQGGLPFDDDVAAFKCSLFASSQLKSKRKDGFELQLKRGEGWNFNKTEKAVRSSWSFGFNAAKKFSKGIKDE